MTTLRDDLAADLNEWFPYGDVARNRVAYDLADRLIALGWTKPQAPQVGDDPLRRCALCGRPAYEHES